MTQNEIKLAAVALYWRNQYEDACPDIGMGSLPVTLLRRKVSVLVLQLTKMR